MPYDDFMKRQQAWLDGLKAGDEVVLTHGHGAGRLETVERATATQLVVGGLKFRRNGGTRIGGASFSRAGISEPNPEARADIRRDVFQGRLSAVKWKDVPLETLEKVAALLDTKEE